MRRSTRVVHVTAALLALSAVTAPRDGARAASLAIVADAGVYATGDPVTLRLLGDSMGATDDTLLAVLAMDPAALQNVSLQRFAPPSPDGVPWIQGGLGCFPDGRRCALINMIHVNPTTFEGAPVGVDPALEPFTYAVLTATAGLPGVYSFDFVTSPFTQRVDFFGLTSAPGITLTIGGPGAAIPEPGAALLFAAGVACVRLRLRRARAHL
jgi:hypothetical protein